MEQRIININVSVMEGLSWLDSFVLKNSVILWPEEGDFPKHLHRAVYVIMNKRSFESVVLIQDRTLCCQHSKCVISFAS